MPETPVATAIDDEPVPADLPIDIGRLRANRLGVIAIAFFVVAAAAPMAAVIGAGPLLYSLVGPATPAVYVLAALLIALFAVGYLRMSHHVTNAGGFVAYIAKGLGNRLAAAGAGIAILMYITLQIGLWAQFGVFAQSLVQTLTKASIPPVAWIVLFVVLLTLLACRGVDASIRVLGVLIVAETLVIAVLIVSLIVQHGFGIFSFTGFTPTRLFGPGLGVAFLFAFLCFTTFEATIVFSEEARNPRRTIPRALYLVIAFVGIFYTLSTWAISGAVGDDRVAEVATKDPTGFIFALATTNAGPALSLAMQILVVTSFIAMLLGIINMFARYLFALGRAGVLPHALARTTKRGTPATAAVVNGVVVGAFLVVFLLAGADPFAVVYAWFSAVGTAAFVTILILASISIVVFFARSRLQVNPLVAYVAPVLSIITFGYVGYLTVANYGLLSGGSVVGNLLLTAVPVFFVAGLLRGILKPDINYTVKAV